MIEQRTFSFALVDQPHIRCHDGIFSVFPIHWHLPMNVIPQSNIPDCLDTASRNHARGIAAVVRNER